MRHAASRGSAVGDSASDSGACSEIGLRNRSAHARADRSGCGRISRRSRIDPALIAILRERTDLANATILEADALTFDYAGFAQGDRWRVAGKSSVQRSRRRSSRIWSRCPAARSDDGHGAKRRRRSFRRDTPVPPRTGASRSPLQFRDATLRRAFTLAPRAFFPAPKVESSGRAARSARRARGATARPPAFREVVRAAFAYRRKTLANKPSCSRSDSSDIAWSRRSHQPASHRSNAVNDSTSQISPAWPTRLGEG